MQPLKLVLWAASLLFAFASDGFAQSPPPAAELDAIVHGARTPTVHVPLISDEALLVVGLEPLPRRYRLWSLAWGLGIPTVGGGASIIGVARALSEGNSIRSDEAAIGATMITAGLVLTIVGIVMQVQRKRRYIERRHERYTLHTQAVMAW
ncbi:MAG: hypothetical protein AAF411_04600 [Myxococcota bacterium]